MSRIDRRAILASASATLAAAVGSFPKPAIAQSAFPSKPITLIVPAPAGSRHGLSARLFADSLSKVVDQPVRVENPDASPALAYSLIASAAADGHTIGFGTVDIAILHWRGLSDLKPASFTPIALINEDPAGLHVRADRPWQSAKDLVSQIKANPGQLKASSTAAGGIWHLSTVSWLGAAGLSTDALPWVPAPGPAVGVEDMMMGGADVIVCSTPEVRITPHAKSVRTLAVMSRNRIPRFGDIPTLQQATGVNLNTGAWRGLIAPAGMDPRIAAAVTATARKAWEAADHQAALTRRGYVPNWSAGKDFASYMEGYSTRLGGALRTSGLVKV